MKKYCLYYQKDYTHLDEMSHINKFQGKDVRFAYEHIHQLSGPRTSFGCLSLCSRKTWLVLQGRNGSKQLRAISGNAHLLSGIQSCFLDTMAELVIVAESLAYKVEDIYYLALYRQFASLL